ncbi:MAG: hypothetical protein JSU75_02940, partial [Gammaproteobacteria bacterium]
NKQLAFDYLRDRLSAGQHSSRRQLEAERLHSSNARIDQMLLRGLCFAIVDEADSVLIDEARTPLVISRPSSNPVEEQTYKQALQRDSENVELMVSYADVLAMIHNGHFTKEASALLQKALELQPDNIAALWLSGHRAYQEERYEESLEYWQRAAGLLPADSPDGIVINQQIAKARQQLGLEGSTATQAAAPASADTAAAPALHVQVSLDAELQDQAGPDDTVFIFARAVDGPRIPLAIVRKQVRDLPLTVTLDDSQAMSPAMVLSGFDNVEVGARISRSGNAMPQSGDLRGSVAPVATHDTGTISLVISETVP